MVSPTRRAVVLFSNGNTTWWVEVDNVQHRDPRPLDGVHPHRMSAAITSLKSKATAGRATLDDFALVLLLQVLQTICSAACRMD